MMTIRNIPLYGRTYPYRCFRYNGIAGVVDSMKPDWSNVCRDGFVDRSDVKDKTGMANALLEFRDADKELYESVRSSLGELDLGMIGDRKRKPSWSEHTGELSIPRIMEGNDSPYRHSKRSKGFSASASPISFVIPSALSRDDSLESSMWRVVSALYFAETVSEAGYPIEIFTLMHSSRAWRGNKSYLASIRVKSYEESFDTAALINLSSSWFVRSMSVTIIYDYPNHTNGCGSPNPISAELFPEEFDIEPASRVIQFPMVYGKTNSIQAVKTLIEELNDQEHS